MNTLNFPVGEIFKFKMETYIGGASLVAQLVKNPPAMQETPVQFLGQEDPLEKDRLPTPVILGFPCGSAGKESAHNAGRPGFNPWVGKIPWRRERLPTAVFWPGEFHGLYSPWSRKKSDFHFSQPI